MSQSKNGIGPRAFIIFCDDIRDEASGKPMLIGVYPTDMVIQAPVSAPIALRMYLVIDGIEIPEQGEIRLELALTFHPDDGSTTTTVLNGQFDVAVSGVLPDTTPQRLVFRPPQAMITFPVSGLLEPHLVVPTGAIPIQGGIHIRFTPPTT